MRLFHNLDQKELLYISITKVLGKDSEAVVNIVFSALHHTLERVLALIDLSVRKYEGKERKGVGGIGHA